MHFFGVENIEGKKFDISECFVDFPIEFIASVIVNWGIKSLLFKYTLGSLVYSFYGGCSFDLYLLVDGKMLFGKLNIQFYIFIKYHLL